MTFIAGPHDPNSHELLTGSVQALSAEVGRLHAALSRVTGAAALLASELPDPGPEALASIYCANLELRRSGEGATSPIAWTPIEMAPARIRDGREVLLWLRAPFSRPAILRWSEARSAWLARDDREDDNEAGIGSLVPSHYTEAAGPEEGLAPLELPAGDEGLRALA